MYSSLLPFEAGELRKQEVQVLPASSDVWRASISVDTKVCQKKEPHSKEANPSRMSNLPPPDAVEPIEVWARVLPDGVVKQNGVAPLPPVDFEDNFTLPAHCVKPLQKLHFHPLDTHLEFFEAPHVYTFRGVPTSCSVTGLAHQFEKEFVPDVAIALMKKKRSEAWPRFKYVFDLKQETQDCPLTTTRGSMMIAGDQTVSVVQAHAMDVTSTPEDIRKVLHITRVDNGSSTDEVVFASFDRPMSVSEIKEAWKRNGKLASNKGTEGHYQCELFLNGLPCRWWEGELCILVEFAKEHMIPRNIVAWNTEKEIVCEDADVAGSIDAILFEPSEGGEGIYHILDFKRSDALMQKLRGKYGKMSDPFKHLDSCNGAAYALQLSIYQYILERDYKMNIGERILLSIHPDAPFTTAVPYLAEEVKYIFEVRFALVRARKQVADEDPLRFRCTLTNAPCVDAVRLKSTGRIAMEKAAIVRDEEYDVDSETRSAFEMRVDEVAQAVDLPNPSLCVAWKRRMPEGGIRPFA